MQARLAMPEADASTHHLPLLPALPESLNAAAPVQQPALRPSLQSTFSNTVAQDEHEHEAIHRLQQWGGQCCGPLTCHRPEPTCGLPHLAGLDVWPGRPPLLPAALPVRGPMSSGSESHVK